MKSVKDSYRCFQILWTCFNQAMVITTVSQKVFTIVLASTSMYGSIRLFGTGPILDYTLMPFTFIGCSAVGLFIYPWGYIIQKHIDRFKLSWRMELRRGNDLEFLLFLKSCKPLNVNVGSFYKFGRKTILTFMQSITDISFDLLVSV